MFKLVFQQEECKMKGGKVENISSFKYHKATTALIQILHPFLSINLKLIYSNILSRMTVHLKEPHFQGLSQK